MRFKLLMLGIVALVFGLIAANCVDAAATAITVTAPATGASIGGTQTISWAVTGTPDNNFTIEYTTDGGVNYNSIASDVDKSLRTYTIWDTRTLPEKNPTTNQPYQYQIRVNEKSTPIFNGTRSEIFYITHTPVISTASVPSATEGKAYSTTLAATDPDGATDTLTWTLKANTFQLGMAITSAGVFSWTPPAVEQSINYSFTAVVTDSTTPSHSAEKALTLTVLPILQIGSVDIEDEDLYPGFSTDITVTLENKGSQDLKEVKLTAYIIDNNGDKISDKYTSGKETLDGLDEKDYDFKLAIPTDTAGGDYKLYLSATGVGDDDDSRRTITDETETVDVQQESHDILVYKLALSKATAKKGEEVTLDATIVNIGEKDEEDVTIKLKSTDLKVDLSKKIDDIKDGKEAKASFTFTVPTTVSDKSYSLDVEASYEDSDDQDADHLKKSILLTVEGAVAPSTTPSTNATTTGKLEGAATASGAVSQILKYSFTLKNNETVTGNYNIAVTGISDWASATVEPAGTLSIASGQSIPIYVYITPKSDATSGDHTASLVVYSNNQPVDSKSLTATLTGGRISTGATGGAVVRTGLISNGFEFDTEAATIILITAVAVLAAGIMVFALIRQKIIKLPAETPRKK